MRSSLSRYFPSFYEPSIPKYKCTAKYYYNQQQIKERGHKESRETLREQTKTRKAKRKRKKSVRLMMMMRNNMRFLLRTKTWTRQTSISRSRPLLLSPVSVIAFSSSAHTVRSKEATSAWLAAGGDGRVTLHDESNTGTVCDVGSGRTSLVTMGINAYGTSTHPRLDVIERSSCTSSSPRLETFAYVDNIRSKNNLDLSNLQHEITTTEQQQAAAASAISTLVESNRTRLMQVLDLDETDVSCIMCASGTDAELMAAIAGIASAGENSEAVQRWTKANQKVGSAVSKEGASLVSILLPGTGSGVGDAAGMRHHSAAAPQTDSVQPGEPLDGVVDGLIVAFEPAQDGIDVTDQTLLREYIQTKKEQTKAPHVLLHAIAGSKTGMHQPPLTVTDALAFEEDENTKSDIIVCIDACQMRVTPEYIRNQLSKGYIVLLTGSKFYGGPPFAGACLLPASRAKDVETMAEMDGGIPSGLSSYFTKDDIPLKTMPKLRSAITNNGDTSVDNNCSSSSNAGLALRWTAALHSMERFQSLPKYMTDRVAKRWVSRVKALAEGFYPAVEVLDAPGIDCELEYRIGNVNTVVSLMIHTGGDCGGLLGVKGLKQLQLLVATDLSDLCDDVTFPKSTKNVSRIKAQLGQPVLLGGGATHGVLRLAIGANDISEVVETAMNNTTKKQQEDDPFAMMDALSESIDEMIINDTKLLRKVELVASHWDAVTKKFDDLPASAVRWQARLAAEGVVGPQHGRKKPQEVTNIDIDFLKPHEMVVNQDRVNALVDAIGRWGAYRKPLLVDRDSGSILDGHHRYFAAQKLGLKKVPAALVDYLNDDSISVELWPGDHGVETISKQDVIDMCLSADVFPPKTSRHTFTEPLSPIFVPLEELYEDA